MLVERVFALGGGVCVAGGLLLLVVAALLGIGLAFLPFLVGAALLVAFGVFFLAVGRDARRERRRLLRSGEEGVVGGAPGRPPR